MSFSKEEIKTLVKDCEVSNQAYIAYLKKYLRELKFKDAKEEIQSKEAELVLTVLFKKLLRKDPTKEAIQIRELKQPKEHIIPNNLYYIYEDIQQILAKRGWHNPLNKT